ncbi:N-acetyltransferase [Nocardioides mangrovicus]|uniref:N-acetyltransferase n=1 Tax=Nocardioides mangrovicus TaxID=2478913 RepID=A0A3L8P5M2_9ACTN|nr:GNAT family protein [Nocardioides mangrovicus]RLV50227.1 N-acetyltransferase [Nocardioides mangrovicus]
MPELPRGPRVHLRRRTADDAAEFTAAVVASAEFHHPWTEHPHDVAGYLDRQRGFDAEPDRRIPYLVCDNADGSIAGYVNVQNIVRYAFRNGTLGYAAFVHAAGKGLMSEALDLVVRHCFDPDGLDLHRLEANIRPDNAPSIALVERYGFRYEGLSPHFLFLDNAWRDHERWAITTEMLPPAAD